MVLRTRASWGFRYSLCSVKFSPCRSWSTLATSNDISPPFRRTTKATGCETLRPGRTRRRNAVVEKTGAGLGGGVEGGGAGARPAGGRPAGGRGPVAEESTPGCAGAHVRRHVGRPRPDAAGRAGGPSVPRREGERGAARRR